MSVELLSPVRAHWTVRFMPLVALAGLMTLTACGYQPKLTAKPSAYTGIDYSALAADASARTGTSAGHPRLPEDLLVDVYVPGEDVGTYRIDTSVGFVDDHGEFVEAVGPYFEGYKYLLVLEACIDDLISGAILACDPVGTAVEMMGVPCKNSACLAWRSVIGSSEELGPAQRHLTYRIGLSQMGLPSGTVREIRVWTRVYDKGGGLQRELEARVPIIQAKLPSAPQPLHPGPVETVRCPPQPEFLWAPDGGFLGKDNKAYAFFVNSGRDPWKGRPEWHCDVYNQCVGSGPEYSMFGLSWTPAKPLGQGVHSWGLLLSTDPGQETWNVDDPLLTHTQPFEFTVDKSLKGHECLTFAQQDPKGQPPAPAAADCTGLSLTSAECANFGEHQYSVSGTLTGDCTYEGGARTRSETVKGANLFSGGQLAIKPPACTNWRKSEPNYYACEGEGMGRSQDGREYTVKNDALITFSTQGFTLGLYEWRTYSDGTKTTCAEDAVWTLADETLEAPTNPPQCTSEQLQLVLDAQKSRWARVADPRLDYGGMNASLVDECIALDRVLVAEAQKDRQVCLGTLSDLEINQYEFDIQMRQAFQAGGDWEAINRQRQENWKQWVAELNRVQALVGESDGQPTPTPTAKVIVGVTATAEPSPTPRQSQAAEAEDWLRYADGRWSSYWWSEDFLVDESLLGTGRVHSQLDASIGNMNGYIGSAAQHPAPSCLREEAALELELYRKSLDLALALKSVGAETEPNAWRTVPATMYDDVRRAKDAFANVMGAYNVRGAQDVPASCR